MRFRASCVVAGLLFGSWATGAEAQGAQILKWLFMGAGKSAGAGVATVGKGAAGAAGAATAAGEAAAAKSAAAAAAHAAEGSTAGTLGKSAAGAASHDAAAVAAAGQDVAGSTAAAGAGQSSEKGLASKTMDALQEAHGQFSRRSMIERVECYFKDGRTVPIGPYAYCPAGSEKRIPTPFSDATIK